APAVSSSRRGTWPTFSTVAKLHGRRGLRHERLDSPRPPLRLLHCGGRRSPLRRGTPPPTCRGDRAGPRDPRGAPPTGSRGSGGALGDRVTLAEAPCGKDRVGSDTAARAEKRCRPGVLGSIRRGVRPARRGPGEGIDSSGHGAPALEAPALPTEVA